MSYWDDRQDQLKEALEKDEEELKKRLSNHYTAESRKLENQISSYYARYGENNVIEYRKMMEKLDNADVTLLMERMNEFGNKYPEYAHLLPIRESIYRLNRMEGLQTSIRMQQLEIGAINNKELEKHLSKNAQRCVNGAADTLGFGKNFYSVDSEIVKNIVNAKWSYGKNFSDSIWENTDKLSNYLNTDIAQAFSRGDSYDRIRKNMKERFENVSRKDMQRLIYTEGTYVMAEASMKPFEEDFEKYGISTVGDGNVCGICKDMAKQKFDIKNRTPGTNFPPFHPWCRCTFRVIVDDWDKWMDDYVEKHGKDASKIKKKFENTNEKSSYSRIGTNDVDFEYINSEEYRKKFSKLTGNTAVNDSLRKYATAILTHRAKTDGEDLYVINAKTGALVARETASGNILQVVLSEKTAKKIDGFKGPIIGMHNHPTNVLPTGSDFTSAGYKKYKFGVVVTHDGRIFKYSVGNKPFLSISLDNRIDKYGDKPYNLGVEDAYIKALEEFRKEYDITWEEIK